jgi:hypothetical protein
MVDIRISYFDISFPVPGPLTQLSPTITDPLTTLPSHFPVHFYALVSKYFQNPRKKLWNEDRQNISGLICIYLPPNNSNKIPGLLMVSVVDVTSSLYIPASSLSTLLITSSGLFTLQELPEYLRRLIIRFVLQLLCIFCQLTFKDPVEFDIIFAFILIVPP